MKQFISRCEINYFAQVKTSGICGKRHKDNQPTRFLSAHIGPRDGPILLLKTPLFTGLFKHSAHPGPIWADAVSRYGPIWADMKSTNNPEFCDW